MSEQGEIFHTSSWLALLTEAFGLGVVRLGIEEDGILIAGLPILTRGLGPIRFAGSPLYNVATPQMGPLLTPGVTIGTVLAAFEDFQIQNGIALAEMIMGQPGDDQALARAGYSIEESRTFLLDLEGRSRDDLWAGFATRCRTAIRKAERTGVEVALVASDLFWPEFRSMVEQVFARQGRTPPIPERFHRALGDRYGPEQLWTVLATHRGQAVAAGLFLVHRGRLYYLDGASDPAQKHLCANNLVQWWAIKRALAQGIELYDLVGAGLPGVAQFKASFGGRLVIRPFARKTNSRLALAGLGLARAALPTLRWARFQFSLPNRKRIVKR
ncbi:MAG TPA: peptidoglycan bridge formation glycyltransferase FemA/FemB family protein [Candidatus Dormibacteraeota bacterium]|nr:peptidoglycan bridge formation glycyltransferase FemA/FemB family protein [Candidatus Dormibacteraeota bacterium]